ncbi:MAG: sugar ABC transporter ATP-binding protein [Lentisphaeria bacterium]|nr:sugar ABC transporter ATP-binding protein [Lentisphaeria bacterium]
MGVHDASTPRLKMAGICKRFGPTVALGGVDLEARAGEAHALIGENGAGKSTLMKVLSGAYQADSGEMWIDGTVYQPRNPLDGRERGVAMIYQELSLAQHLSVMENIVLGNEPCSGPFMRWKDIRRIAGEALAHVGLETLPLETRAGALSNAKQQLIEIARSVATGAKILVFDEPTSSLSRQDIDNLFRLIRELKEKDYAIVYISHFLEEIQEITDRFTVLRDGESVGNGVTAEAAINDIITMMVGRDVDDLYPRSPRHIGGRVCETRHVAGAAKPADVSLDLHRGEVVGIAGVVGAGRTEFLRCLFALDPIRSGDVKIASIDGTLTPRRLWNAGVGIISEDRKREGLATALSIADNLTLSSQPFIITSTWQETVCRSWIEALPIKCASPFQAVDDLSGGNQQKVAIARLLHADVDILLLDEPTRGIDVGSKAQIYQLIDELAAGNPEAGVKPKAILVVSSYLPELLGICDRIGVMCKGKLGPLKAVGDVDEHSIMLEATGAGADEPKDGREG